MDFDEARHFSQPNCATCSACAFKGVGTKTGAGAASRGSGGDGGCRSAWDGLCGVIGEVLIRSFVLGDGCPQEILSLSSSSCVVPLSMSDRFMHRDGGLAKRGCLLAGRSLCLWDGGSGDSDRLRGMAEGVGVGMMG